MATAVPRRTWHMHAPFYKLLTTMHGRETRKCRDRQTGRQLTLTFMVTAAAEPGTHHAVFMTANRRQHTHLNLPTPRGSLLNMHLNLWLVGLFFYFLAFGRFFFLTTTRPA